MILPRLELMARLAGDRGLARDPRWVAQLREDYRYMAAVCRSLVSGLEDEITDLPPSVRPDASIEEMVGFQMALMKRTNRLHRAVAAYLGEQENRQTQAK
jgi:hypothetical protein